MSESQKQQEFRRSLGRLAFLNTLIIHEKKDYIVYFQPMESKGMCKIQVTNGFDFWVEDYDYEKFELRRKKSGLEGTYASYFDMLYRSICQRNFEIILGADQSFTLILFFTLNRGVSLKGEFELGRPVDFDNVKEFHCTYRLFLFDIFRAKDQERMRVEQQKRNLRSMERTEKQSISEGKNQSEEDGEDEEATGAPKKKKQLNSLVE